MIATRPTGIREQVGDGRSPWLDLARRQARSRADWRVAGARPFDWSAVRRGRAPPWLAWIRGPEAGAGGRPRVSWALALLALCVLAAGGATLAVVDHVRGRRVAGTPGRNLRLSDGGRRSAVRARPPFDERGTAPAGHSAGVAPEARPGGEPRKERPPRSPRGSSSVRREVRARGAAGRREQPAKPGPGGSEVIFDGNDMPGGGDVIIVSPPPRLGPLFRPDDFKQAGPRGATR